MITELPLVAQQAPDSSSVPVLVGEADAPGVFRLARVLLLGRVLPLGNDVADLENHFWRHTGVKILWGLKKRPSRGHQAHLDASLQAVLQLSSGRVVAVQAEPRKAGFPDAGVLVEAALELVHCGGGVEAHHL